MDYVNDANELARRIRRFAFGGTAPIEIEDRLQTVPGVQADLIVEGSEILYAHYDLLTEDGKELVGQLYYYANEQGWTTFNGGPKGSDNRSERIVALVRRDLGETGTGVAKASDLWPEPQANRRNGVDWRHPPEPAETTEG